MLSPPKISNIDQYHNKSVISGTLQSFHNIGHSIILQHRSSCIAMYLLPVKTEMDFRDRGEKNDVPEITDLLQYWPMLEFFGGKAWEEDNLKFCFDLGQSEEMFPYTLNNYSSEKDCLTSFHHIVTH